MSGIYKICYTVDNEIRKVFVFMGSNVIEDKGVDINQLYRLEPSNPVFEGVITESDIAIFGDDVELVFTTGEIHLDDTIETIKKKYVLASSSDPPTYSGIYFYSKVKKALNPTSVYQTLTQDGKIVLTRDRLIQFLLNIDDINIDALAVKDEYDYDDILSLDLTSRDFWQVSEPIGQKFMAIEGNYPYTVNPFNVVEYDDFLVRHSSDILTTTNQNLLMESPMIDNNIIYVCLAVDVLKYAEKQKLSQETTISVYYPYLKEMEITSLSSYQERRERLIAETDTLVNDSAFQTNLRNIDMFKDIVSSRKGNYGVIEQGIRKVNITLIPEYRYNMPLDVIFKLVSASKINPIIKYNPARRQEKIYRLYADKTATNGKKIPYLSKGTIFKLMKVMARNREVSVYIESDGPHKSPILLGFFDDGRIEAKLDMPVALDIQQINDVLINSCNPIIDSVSEYLQQRGYNMRRFTDIRDENVVIEDLEYYMKTPLRKKLNLKTITRCVSSVFNVIDDDTVKGATLRFKKVANYNEMDATEAFIVESLNAGMNDVDVVKGLVDNFKSIKNEADAREKLVEFISRQQVVQQAFRNRKVKIKSNPGFLTVMIREKFQANLVTTVTGINDIGYLATIPQYITAMMIITQDPEDSLVPEERIVQLCKGAAVEEEQQKEDVIAPAQEPDKQAQVQALVFGAEAVVEADEEMQEGLLGMLIGDDSDTEEDSEDEDEEQGGGANTPDGDAVEADITGMSLSNPNPFSDRLTEREPTLFLTSVGPGFSSYSRSCPSSVRRQPVILTQAEKDKIDAEHPGSYEHAIEYQTSPDTPKYYYICPRYWSLKDGVSLTQEDVDSGKYGNVIPRSAKTVPPGAGVYEFDSNYHRNDDGEYIGTAPGFIKPSKHPDGKCVPCCYKNWDSPSQVTLREKCQGDIPKPQPAEPQQVQDQDAPEQVKPTPKKRAPRTREDRFDEYVKGPEKFPLEAGRIGYLPLDIQRFLHTDNKKCQVSAKNTNIKQNTPCLVRLGVEKNTEQSFIAAIASIYADLLPGNAVPSIEEMKNIMIQALDIDVYMSLQNGNLVDIFDSGNEVDISKYRESAIGRSLNTENPEELSVFKKIARSYENYISYLSDPNIKISYQYVWDLICFNNEKLFPKGLNLVIIESKDDDITGNVSVICPTNHYASSFFDVNKRAAILLMKNNLFEPLITYEDRGSNYVITRRFSLKYKDMLPNLRKVLETIKASLNDKCGALPSRPNIYRFATNISLERISYILKLKKYTVTHQLMNYSGKIIGLEINKGALSGMIPCFPSAPMLSLAPYKWIDTFPGVSYDKTKQLLTKVNKDSKGEIPSLPALKVVDAGLIVGIITQTNQFVSINPPIQDTFGDDLPRVNDMDYVNTNKMSLTDDNVDEERLKYMKRIKLESGFFNTFRNTLRMLLGQYNHKTVRGNIEANVNNDKLTYIEKLRRVNAELRTLMRDYVSFSEMDEAFIDRIDSISNCNTISIDKCTDKPYCLVSDENCKLMIPKTNLINQIDNEAMYFGRMSDEIVRYSRIRSFIFEPRVFLSFSDLKYNLGDDEIILLQSLLTQDYFDNLIPRSENRFLKYNTYDTAEPLQTETYTNIITENKKNVVANAAQITCAKPKIANVAGKWQRAFPNTAKELVFTDSPHGCTFDIITTILQVHGGDSSTITRNELKEVLADEYALLMEKYSKQLLAMLRLEGKSLIVKQIELGQVNIQDVVMSVDYYVTSLDLWILARRFDLPVILYSATKFPENKDSIIVTTTPSRGITEYYFIKMPGVKTGAAPKMRLLIDGTSAKVAFSSLNAETQRDIQGQIGADDLLEKFLSTFKVPRQRRLKIVDTVGAPKATAAEALAQPKPKKKAKKLKRKVKLVTGK